MHYLITGGCGFIGSHLADRLIAAGHRVTILDDLSTGKRENPPKEAEVIIGDISISGVFDHLVTSVDGVFHLAAVVSVQQSKEDWLGTHRVNLGGTVALFDAIEKTKRRTPVVYASSAAVYGNHAECPLKETAHTMPLSAYGVDKLACEYHAFVGNHIHRIPSIGLRFFNVYGPRQDPLSPYSGVISIFTHRMQENLPITIYGDGEQSRDFIFVGDIVSGLVLAMEKLEMKTLTCSVLNLATGKKTSVNALSQTLLEITGSHSTITHAPPRLGDIRVSLGDVERAEILLGFSAKTSLDDGLNHTLKALFHA